MQTNTAKPSGLCNRKVPAWVDAVQVQGQRTLQ